MAGDAVSRTGSIAGRPPQRCLSLTFALGIRKMTLEWTAERTRALKELWKEGLSTSEIGRRLGLTKNAVIGKAHRLALPRRPSPIRRQVREAEVIRLDALSTGMCSWPEGEPGTRGFRFCGKPTLPGKPYCANHCARAYVKSSKDVKGTEAA